MKRTLFLSNKTFDTGKKQLAWVAISIIKSMHVKLLLIVFVSANDFYAGLNTSIL